MRWFIVFIVFFSVLAVLPDLLSEEELREAMWWEKYGESAVRCNLCPFRCILQEAQTGQCRARKNVGGKLYALNYARVVAAHVDPVEKKPVFHFLPGTPIYSIATAGCNLHCKYCQNWNISQSSPLNTQYTYMDPEDIVKAAKSAGCLSIAYTYTEPIIFYELMYETAKLAKSQGLFNVMISAGFINEEPLRKLCQVMDVIKIDFKSFNEDFYRQVVSGDLSPVLNTMKIIKEQGVWLEVVNLLVPTLNDSPEDIKGLCLWIKENLGSATPVHFSRFHPTYKLTNLPPTPLTTLESAAKIAKDTGLKYVYLGNVPDHPLESTYCPKCGKVLIKRLGYQILENNIRDSRCKFCGEKIEGIWSSDIKKN